LRQRHRGDAVHRIWDQAGLVLFVIFGVIMVTEFVKAWMRGKII
jgi:hypothetical protein